MGHRDPEIVEMTFGSACFSDKQNETTLFPVVPPKKNKKNPSTNLYNNVQMNTSIFIVRQMNEGYYLIVSFEILNIYYITSVNKK